MSLSNPNPNATRVARSAAVLDLTDHELVADLRALRIARSSWMGMAKADNRWYAKTPPVLLDDALPQTQPAVRDFRPARFIERLGANQATHIDPELDALPFDPSSTVEVPAIPRP